MRARPVTNLDRRNRWRGKLNYAWHVGGAEGGPEVSRIESIGMTRSRGRFASLNEARRALVNPDLRSVVFGSYADSLDFGSGSRWPVRRARSSRRGGEGFAGRSAVRRGSRHVARRPGLCSRRHARARHSAAVRGDADFHAAVLKATCPLFVIKRQAGGVLNLLTALPVRNMKSFTGAFGFAADLEDFSASTP